MNPNDKPNPESFAQYLQSMVKLDSLEKMTADLDRELADSQNIMREIKTLFDSIPNTQHQYQFKRSQHEELARFVEAGAPKLLLPDMVQTNIVDIDNIVASMKTYAEELRKSLNEKECHTNFKSVTIEKLDLTPYAVSLDKLSKSLANVKISTDASGRSAELEGKLCQLCEDVTLFTQMVQVNGRLGEIIQNCSNPSNNPVAPYDNLINKLLADINEVTYLLKNN
ncbi:unnamed protein product [Pieris macdunnoughi]|uniref:Uncharacterized protein n=1 Tax=Pieris macdunnoughi TaxID=345717 RepID=A0A821RDU5_9NEOP|nr:unnamed protein product [Pieris macdunnoughi]